MAAENMDAALQAVCQGNQKFCFDFYKVLSEKDGNLFFSPMSVQVILALAHFGAKGSTAQEIVESLNLPSDKKIIEDGFNALMKQMKGSGDTILEIANKIYAQASFPIKQEFRASAEKFIAEAEEVDFIKETEKTRGAINNWVEKKTNKKITNLIPSGVLTELTRLVLVNAIYFKGKWNIPFDEKATTSTPFHVTSTETKNVDMMYIKKKFLYTESEELQAQVLQLGYKGDQMSMVIFLPKKIDGLPELEKKLSNLNLADVLNKMRKLEVKVFLPKFKLEQTLDLKASLQKLGMKSMFDNEKADFTGINDAKPGLVVSHVLHKAFIEVNEEGTEAAAATGMVMMLCSLPPPPVEFRADHPFLFLLKDACGSVLFLGRFITP